MKKSYCYYFMRLDHDTKYSDREYLDRVVNAVQKGIFHFADPTQFNDPFDCMPNVLINFDHPTEQEELYEFVKKDNPSFGHVGIQRHMKEYIPQESPIRDKFIEDLEVNLRKLGVLCLSKTLYNTLLWSHYASGHRGVAIKFFRDEVQALPEEDALVGDVNYQKSRPLVEYFCGDNLEKMKCILFTKSSRWSYEKEIRVIVTEIVKRSRPISSLRPKSLYLGCRISAEHQNELMHRLEGCSISIYKLEPSKKKFKYIRKPILVKRPKCRYKKV